MLAGRLIERTEEEAGVTVVNPTVTWNPSASPLEITLKDWNRGFELGTLLNWTAVDAEISTVEPYEGSLFCCKLIGTGSSIIQTLDDPCPVTGVWLLRFRCRSAVGTGAVMPIINYTDGTSSGGGQTIFPDEWTDVFMLRRDMSAEKIVSGIGIQSAAGEIFIDDVFFGLATDIITGAVEIGQGTPRNLQGEMTARPKGGIPEAVLYVGDRKRGSEELNTATWTTIIRITPLTDWKLELAKILVSCPDDIIYRLVWAGTVISAAEIYVTGGIPFTDWFPWNYYPERMRGDGSRTFELQARSIAGTPTCHAEMVGEYVDWAFNL